MKVTDRWSVCVRCLVMISCCESLSVEVSTTLVLHLVLVLVRQLLLVMS